MTTDRFDSMDRYASSLQGTRRSLLWRASIMTAVIAVVDWYFEASVFFGFLYLFPMLMLGSCLRPLPIALAAALCTGLAEAFDPFPWFTLVVLPRLILTFSALFGAGLYVFEVTRNRRLAASHIAEVERQSRLREEAEQQLQFVIETSPATIFTIDKAGVMLLANAAAHRLLGVAAGTLPGQRVERFFPDLANVPPLEGEAPAFRTTMECHAHRQDGEVFLARICFSTYRTVSGPRLAAVVFDTSDDLREREEFSLRQVLAGSKILVGAVFHEIRNICGAIGNVYLRLSRNPMLAGDEDLRALGPLVAGLERMSGMQLRQTAQPQPERLDVLPVLEDLRIVIEPSFREAGIAVRWELSPLPLVWAETPALMQALLNITKNSHRAMLTCERKEFVVRTSLDGGYAVIRFIDSGAGVPDPRSLFKPFQQGASETGLGLYLSRAFLRAFEGDIVHEPQSSGCCFAVRLKTAEANDADIEGSGYAEDPITAA